MSTNIFLKPEEFYQRQLNPLGQYVVQNGYYLSKMTGKDLETCKQYISNSIKTKTIPGINDPVVNYFERGDNGDTSKYQMTLSNYINDVNNKDEILVPTFTSYINTKYKKSPLVEFIDANVKRRSLAKKEAEKAKANNQYSLYVNKNNEQANMKTYNNSMSGAFAAKGSVLYNPSAHSTLTSMTRSVSSIGNASNEKIIAGNRHYRTPDITLFNLISICCSADVEGLSKVINKYGLNYPTVEQTIECVTYSSGLYWNDSKALLKISSFIEKLSEVERAAIVYTGDLYHIRKHNDGFVRTFLSRMSRKVTGIEYENPLAILKATDEHVINYLHQICLTETRGIGKDYLKVSVTDLNTLAATAVNIVAVIEEYRDFISAIFLTKSAPGGTAYIADMVRRTVVVSDTDSTMFSLDEWVMWYFGKLTFAEEAFGLAGAVMFIATQCIAHNLAILSANINVAREKLFALAMKPEFVFDLMAVTSVAKHYYTCISVKEGNVYKEKEMEIKGVYLKNSAAPKILIDDSQSKMKDILETVISGKKISLTKEIKRVADIERKIKESLLNGHTDFYKQSKIKTEDAYARSAEGSPYLHHLLWKDIFEAKYGSIENPIYNVIKIPTILENKTAIANWLVNMTDEDISNKLKDWLAKYNKTSLPTMYLSTDYVKAFGIPVEIKSIINVKKIVLELTITDRMILETLGYFPKHEWLLTEQGY
jgi:hypothetical protein